MLGILFFQARLRMNQRTCPIDGKEFLGDVIDL
jgi:hypothetical protein